MPNYPLSPLSSKQIPMETIKAIKESLYDDGSMVNVQRLSVEYKVSMTYMRWIRFGDRHGTVEPILSTQR